MPPSRFLAPAYPAGDGFVRCGTCTPPDPVYWLDKPSNTLHHIHACGMCGKNLCGEGMRNMTIAEKSAYTTGSEFTCSMLPAGSTPIDVSPLLSAATLPSFTLNLR